MNKLDTQTFKYTLRDIHKNTDSRKFCFILGAGASYTAGIPTGASLAKTWFNEIKERYSKGAFDHWKKEENIEEEDLAASYGAIYRKRFEADKTSGYEFLVQIMRDANPTFGHIVLAQILSKAPGHCVLTTNFDNLVESALFQFTDKTPLVCGHESLAGYARPSNIHPLVIKIHRDLLLAPKNDPDEINQLDISWKEPLDLIFSNHIPIVLGYGGNDGSLMTYFEKMNKPSNFFWCELEGSEVSDRVEKLIEDMNGNLIEIKGFDELMHELLWVFDEIKPINEELNEIAKKRIENANVQQKNIEKKLSEADLQGLEDSKTEKHLSALEWSQLADKEFNLEKRKKIYLNALKKYPNTFWLWSRFIHFLQFTKFDYLGLEEYYQKAFNIKKDDSNLIGNYAIFLNDYIQDYENAEKHYLKALNIEPDNIINNGNYAKFLHKDKKDYKNAEKHYLKALSIEPDDIFNNGNYAQFLHWDKKDYENAEKYYLKALSIDPNDAIINTDYGYFLMNIKKDYENAEKHYLKGLSINPDSPNFNGNYCQFLFIQGKNKDAIVYLNKALSLNNNQKVDLAIELYFYKYAHIKETHEESEIKIEELLEEGVRAVDWDFTENINVAIKNGHPNPKKLKELAIRIGEEVIN